MRVAIFSAAIICLIVILNLDVTKAGIKKSALSRGLVTELNKLSPSQRRDVFDSLDRQPSVATQRKLSRGLRLTNADVSRMSSGALIKLGNEIVNNGASQTSETKVNSLLNSFSEGSGTSSTSSGVGSLSSILSGTNGLPKVGGGTGLGSLTSALGSGGVLGSSGPKLPTGGGGFSQITDALGGVGGDSGLPISGGKLSGLSSILSGGGGGGGGGLLESLSGGGLGSLSGGGDSGGFANILKGLGKADNADGDLGGDDGFGDLGEDDGFGDDGDPFGDGDFDFGDDDDWSS